MGEPARHRRRRRAAVRPLPGGDRHRPPGRGGGDRRRRDRLAPRRGVAARARRPADAPSSTRSTWPTTCCPTIDHAWIGELTNVLLIRDPREVVASYTRTRATVTPDDIGLPQQVRLYDELPATAGAPPPVDRRRRLPRATPSATCAPCATTWACAFTDRMLSWPPGPRPTDGVWAPHWYDAVWRSTGFEPPRTREVHLDGAAAEVAEACLPLYERLRGGPLGPLTAGPTAHQTLVTSPGGRRYGRRHDPRAVPRADRARRPAPGRGGCRRAARRPHPDVPRLGRARLRRSHGRRVPPPDRRHRAPASPRGGRARDDAAGHRPGDVVLGLARCHARHPARARPRGPGLHLVARGPDRRVLVPAHGAGDRRAPARRRGRAGHPHGHRPRPGDRRHRRGARPVPARGLGVARRGGVGRRRPARRGRRHRRGAVGRAHVAQHARPRHHPARPQRRPRRRRGGRRARRTCCCGCGGAGPTRRWRSRATRPCWRRSAIGCASPPSSGRRPGSGHHSPTARRLPGCTPARTSNAAAVASSAGRYTIRR